MGDSGVGRELCEEIWQCSHADGNEARVMLLRCGILGKKAEIQAAPEVRRSVSELRTDGARMRSHAIGVSKMQSEMMSQAHGSMLGFTV